MLDSTDTPESVDLETLLDRAPSLEEVLNHEELLD